MKKQLQNFLLITGLIMAHSNADAQTISTFENLSLAPDSFWNGSASPGGTTFSDGNAVFPNSYDWGYWMSGWSYSNMKDSTTAGYTNMYSAIPAAGYQGSSIYAVGMSNSKIKLTGNASSKVVQGMYVTNGTYAAISMRDGDQFARKFGDTTNTNSGLAQGSYPDWFKLTIKKYLGGSLGNDSIEFYLADFRFQNNAEDYIVKTWEYVDLTSLGNVDSLEFSLSSSDVGQWGMNTPGFFCIDNFSTSDIALTIPELKSPGVSFSMYPNPVKNNLYVAINKPEITGTFIEIFDVTGKSVYSSIIEKSSFEIPTGLLPSGIYHLKVSGKNRSASKTFIRE